MSILVNITREATGPVTVYTGGALGRWSPISVWTLMKYQRWPTSTSRQLATPWQMIQYMVLAFISAKRVSDLSDRRDIVWYLHYNSLNLPHALAGVECGEIYWSIGTLFPPHLLYISAYYLIILLLKTCIICINIHNIYNMCIRNI